MYFHGFICISGDFMRFHDFRGQRFRGLCGRNDAPKETFTWDFMDFIDSSIPLKAAIIDSSIPWFIGSGGWLAGWLAGWLLAAGWMVRRRGFQGRLTRSTLWRGRRIFIGLSDLDDETNYLTRSTLWRGRRILAAQNSTTHDVLIFWTVFEHYFFRNMFYNYVWVYFS